MRRALRACAFVAIVGILGCARPLALRDAEQFPRPPPNAITFWGHSCCYVDLDGFGIVTDPVFVDATHFRVRKGPAPPPPSYRGARLILISHAHPDHLNPRTLATFPSEAVILCPAPAAEHLEDLDHEVRIMRPGDEVEFPGGRVVAVAAHHAGGRWGVRSTPDGGALGYVIAAPEVTLFYSGDTDFFEGFESVGDRFRPDIALLNINGHLYGEDAVRAARATRAATVIPLHFGSYGYLDGPERQTPRDYDEMKRFLGPELVLLGLGESLALPAEPAP